MLQPVWPNLRSPKTTVRFRRTGGWPQSTNSIVLDRIPSAVSIFSDHNLDSRATTSGKSWLWLHDAVQHDKRKRHDAGHVGLDPVVVTLADVNIQLARRIPGNGNSASARSTAGLDADKERQPVGQRASKVRDGQNVETDRQRDGITPASAGNDVTVNVRDARCASLLKPSPTLRSPELRNDASQDVTDNWRATSSSQRGACDRHNV